MKEYILFIPGMLYIEYSHLYIYIYSTPHLKVGSRYLMLSFPKLGYRKKLLRSFSFALIHQYHN